METMNTIITAQNLTKTFIGRDGVPIIAVDNVDFTIKEQEFIAVVGPSGCGKSTLLMMIAGLESLTSGELLLEGEPIDGPDIKCGVVFQEYLLFPWKTVEENIAFGPSLKGVPKNEIKELCRKFVKLVGLEGFEKCHPHELSGGMCQRVAIARVLANDTKILLMDEPFGALDALTREEMQTELMRIWQKTTSTVLFVTHSISEAVYLADRVIIMSKRPGKIKKIIEIDLPRPRTREDTMSDQFKEYEIALRRSVWEEV